MRAATDPPSTPHGAQKILIVDDREENLRVLAQTLEETHATIIQARSGNEALRASLNHEFALAILDVKMPVMDGFELAGFLHGDEKTRNIPIIFLTAALFDEQDIFKGYQSGAVDYITKPFDPLILRSKVRIFLELARQREELDNQAALIHAANKELESFSYSVSHDLRVPLRIIHGAARILLKKHLGQLDPGGQKYLSMIACQVDKMDTLINDLLTFSRLGRRPIEASEIDMNELARELSAEFELTAAGRELRFEMGTLPPAHGDRAMIRQVFVNLLSNAIKFTQFRSPAVIEIGHRYEGHDTIFYVRDNGVGFDMQYRNKLFDVFQRLHSSTEFDGSGVGLALVRRIVERHGGDVWAEGKVDEGATFYFTLQRAG